MNVGHIRKIDIISSTIRIYLSIYHTYIQYKINEKVPNKQQDYAKYIPFVLNVMASLITMNGFRVNKVLRICSFTSF